MSNQKNILLISLDDAFAYWKYRSVFGAELKTPNLDRICAVSTAFQSAYCQIPVCGPSRSSFLSGMTPHQLGIFDNYTNVFDVLRPEQMWSYRLKQAGFYCSNAGKVHHGFKPLPDKIHNVLYSHASETINIGPGQNAKVKNYGGKMKGLGTIDPKFDEKYYDAQSARSAINFFDSYDREEPFYREVGFYHPHSPYKTPARFKDMYDPGDFHQPNSWAEPRDKNAFADLFMQENLNSSDQDMWRKSVRNYFSAFSHVDYHLGRVWDALQASPHAKNTVVVILADHGYHPGDKNRFRKYTLWEESAGVPVIIHDPTNPVGREITDPVALLDIGPTVLDYANCPPIDHCAGQSLRPQVDGKDITGRAVPTFFFGSAAIRKGDYRYILYQDGTCQLYNLREDLWQHSDISKTDPICPDMHAALVATCKDYGLEILDIANKAPAPNDYCSVTRNVAPPDRITTKGAVTVGSLSAHDSSPEYRRHFATLAKDDTIALPDSIRGINPATDYRFGIKYFGIAGNDRGNHYNFVGGHNRFLLDIDCGTGDDIVHGHLDQLRVRLNAGNNRVITGHTGSVIYGGAGHDVIVTADGDNIIHGGTGDAEIITSKGNDTITTGSGKNRIICRGGMTKITVDQGQNEVVITGGDVTLIIKRTGLPQVIKGFARGRIDLSDWSALGVLKIVAQNKNTVVTAGTECICFVGTKKPLISAALEAASL